MDRRYQRYEDYFTFSDSSVIYNEQTELAAQAPFSGNRNVGVPASPNQNAMTTTSRELESFESENGRLGLQQRKFSDMIPRMQGMGGNSMESEKLNIAGSQIMNTTSGMQVRAADAQSHEWSRNVDLEMCTNEPQHTQHEFEKDRLERTEPYQMHKMSVEYNAEESYDSTLPRREPAYQQKQAYSRVSDNTVFSDDQNIEQDHFWRDDYDNNFNHAQRHEGYPQLGRERDERFLPNQDHYRDQDMHPYDKEIQQGGFNSYSRRWSSQRNEKPYDSNEYNTPQDYQSDGLEMPAHERWDYSREGNYSSQHEWQTNKASALRSRGRYPLRGRGQFSRNGQHLRGEEFFRGQRHQNKRGKFPPRGHTLLPKQNQTRGRGSQRGSRAHPGQGRGRGRGQSKPDQLRKQPYGGKQKSASQEKAALMETSYKGHQNLRNKPEHVASNEKEKTVTSQKQLHTKNTDLQCESPNSGEKSVEVDEKQNTRAFENQSGSVKSEERDALNSPKQDVQPDEKDDVDAEDVSEEDTSFCKLCAMSFDSSEKYFRHTRGLLHTQRLMAQDTPKPGVSDTQNTNSALKEELKPPISQVEQVQLAVRQKPVKLSPSSVQKNASADTSQGLALINSSGFDEDDEFEDEEENPEETFAEDGAVDKEGNFEEFRCKLCDVKTTGPVSMRAHLSGKSHKMIQEAVEKGFPVPQRVLKKIGPDAQVPHSEYKPSVSLIHVSGPSILVDTLRAVPEAIVGLPAVREYQLSKQPSFTCTLCDAQCDLSSIQTHIIGSKHRMKFLKTNHPDIYEHVKAHGGKKSQLSAFLEEVCSDIESKEGRGVPLVQKPAAKESNEKEEGGEAEDSQESSRAIHKEDDRGASSAISSAHMKRLPHDIVVARYKEERRRREMDKQSFGHFEGGRGRGRYPGPPDALSYYEGARGHGRPYDDYNWFPDRPHGPPFSERWGREGDWDRGTEPPFYGPPGRYPYWDNRPRGFSDEEDRIRHMYEYERHAFYHPAVGISHQEEQHRMMFEYERLGIPYEEARRRMMMQDDRRMRLSDMVRSGMPMDEARQRIMAEENRVLLLQEYEKQGLSAREARHRIIVEEERQKLLDEYERRGVTAMEARKRIASGDIRLHFTREFERRGMTLEEARMQAFREEEQQQRYLELYYGDVQPRNPYRRQEPPLSEAALLKRHLQQGLKLEDAKNKVIACLRAEGIPTHEAILRVEKIEVTPDMLKPEENRRSLDDREHGSGCREEPKHMVHAEEDKMQAKIRKFAEDDLDSISVDEAKERLLQEYMRRGVPREEARQSLISELIRQGVSPEEARRRFRDPPKAYQSGNHSPSPDSSHKTERRDRSRRSRSRSSSGSSSQSRVRDYTKRSRSFCTEEREKGRKLSRESQASERSKGEKHHGPRETYSERKHRVPDCEDPPTLTLGEELKRMKMKRRLEAYEKELAQKQAKTSTSSSSSETPSTSTFSKIKLQSQPKTSSSSDPGPKTDVKELLENLTNNLISSEDDAAAALQVSKALTSALLKYRFKATPNEDASKSQQSLATFPERRISDVKKTV